MNSIYRSIWNDKAGTFVAVSENAKAAGKKSSSCTGGANARFTLKALSMSVMLALGANVYALPVGGVVAAGGATITSGTSSMTVNQSTPNAVINWQNFNVAQGQSVQFVQPNASAVALNRVIGANPSSILGSLSANGKVFLVNPNGILFGQNASVNVGGLVASTLNITDANFMAGKYKFAGAGNGTVLNQGSINADGGFVTLLGANVSNQGVIAANMGTVALAAGNAVTLDMAGDGLLNVTVNQGAVDALVENGGLIRANGGQVLMTASAAGNLLKTVVNNTGVIEALTVENHNGTIKLLGAQSGAVIVSGILDASGTGAGQTGGTVHVLGDKVALVAAHIDASGNAGGGTVLIGGDTHGANPAVQNATTTYVGKDSTFTADAINAGNGGKVIVWADGTTRFYGDITARGGIKGGDGGFTEVSGKNNLVFSGNVDLRAPRGKTGTLLLDPNNIIIQAATPDLNGDGITGDDLTTPNILFADYPGKTSTITTAQIVNQLTTADVRLEATNDITVASAVTWGTAHTLELNAGHDVIINAAIDASAVGAGIKLIAGHDVLVKAALSTSGANTLIDLSAGHDVIANAALTVSGADARMALSAAHDVLVNAAITASGANSLIELRADKDGTGPGLVGGTVIFGAAPAPLTGIGAASAPKTLIRFNPTNYANTSVEIANYTAKVTGALDAKAWVFAQGNDKVYDGTRTATLAFRGNPTTGGNVTLVPGTATFDTKNVGTDKTVTYTGYTVAGTDVAKFALFAVAANEVAYQAVVGSGTTKAAISQAPLTVTANNATKTYGQTATFATSAFTSVGLVNAETIGGVTETSPGTVATAVAGTTYAITPSDAIPGTFAASNYAINYVNGTLTVTPLVSTPPVSTPPNSTPPDSTPPNSTPPDATPPAPTTSDATPPDLPTGTSPTASSPGATSPHVTDTETSSTSTPYSGGSTTDELAGLNLTVIGGGVNMPPIQLAQTPSARPVPVATPPAYAEPVVPTGTPPARTIPGVPTETPPAQAVPGVPTETPPAQAVPGVPTETPPAIFVPSRRPPKQDRN
jgi:filamentous hemagglutinin family protein